MDPLDLVRLGPLMARTRGRSEISIALIDGPVETAHPDLARHAHLRALGGSSRCSQPQSASCRHGTFVAGILAGRRGGAAPGISPDCTLLLRPIFSDRTDAGVPSAEPHDLAQALLDCTAAGARIINLSAALAGQPRGAHALAAALDHAARHGVIIVAAAGNEGTVAGSVITAHPAVIPVAGCDGRGRPMPDTNLGGSIGRNGLSAPGDAITSLDAAGGSMTMAGTSAAAPFVAGALALLWSEFPRATARMLRAAIGRLGVVPRRSVVPPLLDAHGAWQALRA